MKTFSLKNTLILLRVCIITLVLALISIFLISFTASRKIANDFWTALGITQPAASSSIRNSFMNGYLEHYSVRNPGKIALEKRAEIAQDLLTYTKTFLASENFRKQYEKERLASKPRKDETRVRTREQVRTEELAKLEKSRVDMAKAFQTMGMSAAEQKKSLDEFDEMLAEYKKPNSMMIDAIYEGEVGTAKRNEEDYLQRVKKWESEYPADHNIRLKRHIEKYLKLAATVDFSAQLKDRNSKKVFVNPTYEGKSTDWKLIFRAGKEVYDVAKPFAESWLQEL
ncbi:MAG: hypothetical protein EOO01_26085 [Chitinophagaceae bacterium]|nr:MAG: hypothetical protein EOO01_26085 [Chitinophagaceae bacterium]